MRIGIDATILNINYESGQKHYLQNLLAALSKIDRKNEYFIFCAKETKIPSQKNFRLVETPSWLPILKRQIVIPFLSRQLKIDVLHYPNVWANVLPISTKTVITLHDFAPDIVYPKLSSGLGYYIAGKINGFIRPFALKNASQVIVDSESIRSTCEKFIQSKSTVIHLGVENKFKPQKNKNNQSYFLAFADFSPRKNIGRILGAYSRVIQDQRLVPNIKIVISTNFPKKEILRIGKQLRLSKKINILQKVKNKDIPLLYSNALCLLFPSLYEGFGMPILEAMASGCPVITTNYGATKEIAGSAALLVDPLSEKGIANAMKKVLTNTNLASCLKNMGRSRSKKFTWEKTARMTLDIYRSAAGF